MTTPHDAAANANLGVPTARKSGRNPEWPYVPVIRNESQPRHIESQILGVAYKTRAEAVQAATDYLAREREELERKLSQPNYRALRAQYRME